MLLLAFGSATPAAIAELFSKRIDDNLTIPLAAAIGAVAASAMLGI